MDDEILREELSRYARRVCAAIRSRRARAAAEEEITDHLLCAVYDKALHGIPPERAVAEALAEFGDAATLKQQYARIHNTLPPDLWPSLGRFFLRALGAAAVTAVLWGIVESGGGDFGVLHLLPGALMLFGLWPIHAISLVGKRISFHLRLRRLCRRGACEALYLPALPGGRYVLRAGGRVLYLRVMGTRRAALRFLDETAIAWITRRGGVGMIDRAPRRFNSTKIAAQASERVRVADFSFLLPEAWLGTGVEKHLILLPFPREVTCVRGNTIEEVRPGERVLDFSVHDRKNLMKMLEGKP